jgi:uncharacterized membrane protein YbhN (UPF0104 family)
MHDGDRRNRSRCSTRRPGKYGYRHGTKGAAVNKSFAAWMMSVGLLLCMVAGVGYLAKPVTLPAPFRIDVLLATGMAAAAFALGALSDRLVEQLGRVRARRRTEARERQRQAEWETSENGAAERVT